MREQRVHLPSEIARDFERVFGDAGVVVLHSAARSIGRVAGGIEGVFGALLHAIPSRTLVVPTFTAQRTDPSSWDDPPPEEQWDAIRAELPRWDPLLSPPRGMGRIAELVQRLPDACRSSHPVESIAAIGPRAAEIVAPHPLDDPMGPRSPWARLVACDARVVLVGVGLERCSIVHHAERLAQVGYLEAAAYAMAVDVDDERRWIAVESGAGCSEGFTALEPKLRTAVAVRDERIGDARVLVLSAREVVATALRVLQDDPGALLCRRDDCQPCQTAREALGTRARPAG